jgi:virulence factor
MDRNRRQIHHTRGNTGSQAGGSFAGHWCKGCPDATIHPARSLPPESPAMIRLGIVDFDTSHVLEFTRRLLHKGVAEDQWVEGAQIVAACPGDSKIMPERIPGYVKEMKALEIPLVDKPEDLIGKVDGMLIESQEGGRHWERARLYLEAGIPCYVDKPFTCSTEDARKIIALGDKKGLPVFSSSSLRYVPELIKYLSTKPHGKILGATTYGPASLHERNPGFYHYGIHAVEMLYAAMGPGCDRVTCLHEEGADLVTGHWRDGRIGCVRGIRAGKADYGCLVFAEKAVDNIPISTKFIYRELLKQIVQFFQTKRPPLDPRITFEIVAFIEAAFKSGNNHGISERLAV